MKRLNAPKHWMLDKLGGIWAPRPSTGPHKLRECVPLVVLIRNRLKYALTRREVTLIVMQRLIRIDGKIRTDANYPAGLMDVITIEKTSEQFRLLYDVKGRFVLHRITPEESAYKLCRVRDLSKSAKAYAGKNPFLNGKAGSIPYLVTHDGRTIRYPNPDIKINDTIKVDIKTGKILEHFKFEPGQVALIIRGNNVGRVGTIISREHHASSYDIIHLKDKHNAVFATRLQNVFVIGNGATPAVSLPKRKGVRLSILEERDRKIKKDSSAVKA